jgi:hypothetical protein
MGAYLTADSREVIQRRSRGLERRCRGRSGGGRSLGVSADGDRTHVIGIDHRFIGPRHVAGDGQADCADKEQNRQDSGRLGQQIAGAAGGHEARRASAHAQRPAFGALQQDHPGEGDRDQDHGDEQDGLEHGVNHVGAWLRRSSGGV